MENIVIFGGTFDPVHKGHTNLLEAVCREMSPDKVIVMPARIPPHKVTVGMAAGKDRLNMCRLAFSDYSNVTVSDFELKRTGKSYSYYTVKHFSEKYPHDKLWFVMGSDMLLYFDKWYRYEDILKLCGLICVSRNEGDRSELIKKADSLSSLGEVKILTAAPFEISSTRIRDMLKNDLDTSRYMDETVVKYIKENNIYKWVMD